MGRNAVWGARVTFYRPTTIPGTGGQAVTTWVETLSTKLELYGLTDEQRRQVFGLESVVELAAFAAANTNVQPLDGCVVLSGPRTGVRFRVVRTISSRSYLEIGLRSTTEVIP